MTRARDGRGSNQYRATGASHAASEARAAVTAAVDHYAEAAAWAFSAESVPWTSEGFGFDDYERWTHQGGDLDLAVRWRNHMDVAAAEGVALRAVELHPEKSVVYTATTGLIDNRVMVSTVQAAVVTDIVSVAEMFWDEDFEGIDRPDSPDILAARYTATDNSLYFGVAVINRTALQRDEIRGVRITRGSGRTLFVAEDDEAALDLIHRYVSTNWDTAAYGPVPQDRQDAAEMFSDLSSERFMVVPAHWSDR